MIPDIGRLRGGNHILRISVFVAFLLVAMGGIAAWSFANGAGAGTIALRVFLTAVVLQVGYGLLLVVSAYLPEGRPQYDEKMRKEHDGKPASRPVSRANGPSR